MAAQYMFHVYAKQLKQSLKAIEHHNAILFTNVYKLSICLEIILQYTKRFVL